MKIIEEFIQGKNKDEKLCEDGIFISEDFLAVIDGATAKSDREDDGKKSGRIAMEVIKKSLASLSANVTAYNAIKSISMDVSKICESYGILNNLERPTASIVVYSCCRQEIWMLGDCQVLADNKLIKNDKLIDALLAEVRSCYLYSEILNGVSIKDLMIKDTGREFILPMLKKQSTFQNSKEDNEYVYGVIDGMEVLEKFIKIIDVSKIKQIVLASDGYPQIFATLKQSEDYLSDIIKKDPLCFIINKSTKGIIKDNLSFDDRAYISFQK